MAKSGRYNLISKMHNFNNRGESGNGIERGLVKVNLEIPGIYDLLKVHDFFQVQSPVSKRLRRSKRKFNNLINI